MQGGRLGPRRVELLLRDVYGRVCPAAMNRFDEVDYRELHPHDLALVEPTLKEETRKGHCFLGFKKEVHHEFNY